MARFVVEFTTDNAAFVEGGENEVARLLTKAGDLVLTGVVTPGDKYPLMDTNGARVGVVRWEE